MRQARSAAAPSAILTVSFFMFTVLPSFAPLCLSFAFHRSRVARWPRRARRPRDVSRQIIAADRCRARMTDRLARAHGGGTPPFATPVCRRGGVRAAIAARRPQEHGLKRPLERRIFHAERLPWGLHRAFRGPKRPTSILHDGPPSWPPPAPPAGSAIPTLFRHAIRRRTARARVEF